MASQFKWQSSLFLGTGKESFKGRSNHLCQKSITINLMNILCMLHTKHCCTQNIISKEDLICITKQCVLSVTTEDDLYPEKWVLLTKYNNH